MFHRRIAGRRARWQRTRRVATVRIRSRCKFKRSKRDVIFDNEKIVTIKIEQCGSFQILKEATRVLH
jgi:hypothetical protein